MILTEGWGFEGPARFDGIRKLAADLGYMVCDPVFVPFEQTRKCTIKCSDTDFDTLLQLYEEIKDDQR